MITLLLYIFFICLFLICFTLFICKFDIFIVKKIKKYQYDNVNNKEIKEIIKWLNDKREVIRDLHKEKLKEELDIIQQDLLRLKK